MNIIEVKNQEELDVIDINFKPIIYRYIDNEFNLDMDIEFT